MTDVVTTLSLIVLAQQYRGDIIRQINRRSLTLKLLKIVAGEGKNCAWGAEGDGALAENYAEGADAANFGGDAQAPATANWGLYRANIHVTKLAMDAAKTTASPLGNQRLWARQVMNGAGKLASILNAAIHTGAGTGTTIGGFGVACGNATNTYAGIDRSNSDYSYFRPYVIDPGSSTAPSFSQIRTDLAAIYTNSGEYPDLAFVTPAVFNSIGGLFDPSKLFMVETVNTAKGPVQLEGSFRGIEFDGCVFIKDKDATANAITYVNSNHVRIEYLPSADIPDEISQMVEADDGFGAVPLGMTFEKLAKTGPSSKAQILASCQLVVERPNACGMRKNVAA